MDADRETVPATTGTPALSRSHQLGLGQVAEYQITCVIKSTNPRSSSPDASHDHITDVGFGNGVTWSVKEVLDAMRRNDTFFTVSPTMQATAEVREYTCDYCRLQTLRSRADGVWNNNLDNLPACA